MSTAPPVGSLHRSDAVNRIDVSPTMAVLIEAEKLKARGIDVVDFGPGEPDFPTPEHIKRAAIRALEENRTKYTPTGGIMALREVTGRFVNVEIDSFAGLLMEYARQKQARVILRGIRAVSDYEYELQMALMNRKLEPQVETVFMLPGEAYSYLSSRLVREVARLGGSLKGLVPAIVEERLRGKIG